MIPRQQVLDTYWRFAAERQEIFFRRLLGRPAPWTSDPILDEYKFCNAYRASDRVSQYLIKNVIYDGSKDRAEVIFRILLFKLFNKIETWEYLKKNLKEITTENFDQKKYAKIFESQLANSIPIYSNAYIMCANNAFGYDKKHLNHLALIDKMCIKDNIADTLAKTKSFEEVFDILKSYPLIGDFMAYQLATDINYSNVIDFPEDDFTIAGPGAQRGIAKCFIEQKDDADTIRWMQRNQQKEFSRLGIKFKDLFGRPLQLIDCQNIFCETDKYTRVAIPNLKSNRVRIKTRFAATTRPIEYFYPPKWGINKKIRQFMEKNKH